MSFVNGKQQVSVEYFSDVLMIQWREDGAEWFEVRDRTNSNLLGQFATYTEALDFADPERARTHAEAHRLHAEWARARARWERQS